MSKSSRRLACSRWAGSPAASDTPLRLASIRTNLQRYVLEEDLARLRAQSGGSSAPQWKTPGQGAATSVLVATSPLLEGIGGRYFEDCDEAGLNQPGTRTGVAAYALDPEAAGLLWQVSVDMLAT